MSQHQLGRSCGDPIHELGALGSAYSEIRVLRAKLARVQKLLDHDPTTNVTPAKLRVALNERITDVGT